MVRAHKYNAVKAARGNRSFASKLEGSLYDLLLIMEKLGEIKDIKTQPNIFLTEAKIKMIPDFSYIDVPSGELIYAEAKGVETDTYRIKRKLWLYYGPGPLVVYKMGIKRITLYERLIPKNGGYP